MFSEKKNPIKKIKGRVILTQAYNKIVNKEIPLKL
jgi:hypothetical protein